VAYRLLALILFFSFAAQAEDTELEFRRGRVRLRGVHLEVETPAGFQPLSNLWLTYKDGKVVNDTKRVGPGMRLLRGLTPETLEEHPFLNFDTIIENPDVIPNVTSAYFKQGEKEYVVMAFNKSPLQFGGYNESYSIAVIEVKSRGEGLHAETYHFINGLPRYPSGHHYTNEVALLAEEGYVATYDDRAGRMLFFRIIEGGNAIALAGDLPPVAMPWRIKLADPLAAQAKVHFNPSELTLTLAPLGDSPKMVIPLADENGLHYDRKDRSPIGMKAEDRTLWTPNAAEAVALLKREARYEKSLDLSSFGRWSAQSLATLIPVESPGRVRQLLVQMPGLTIDRQPELSQEASLQVLENLDATQKANATAGVTFVKLPTPWFDMDQVTDIISRALQTHQRETSGRARHHFIVLDARVLGLRKNDEAMLTTLQTHIGASAAKIPGLSVHLVVLGRKETLESYEAQSMGSAGRPTETRILAIDDAFSESFKLKLILQLLPYHYHGEQPTEADLKGLIERIREHSSNKNVLSNLDEFLNRLGSILEARQPKFTESSSLEEVVSLYRKLSGDRRPAKFDADIVNSADQLKSRLSASSPPIAGSTAKRFVDRDAILESAQNEIVNWLHYRSQHESPNLILLFMGDQGTGKTTLTKEIARSIKGAKLEEIKVSDLEKQFDQTRREGGYWMTPEAHLIMTLQAAADRLILDPNPVKILFIDEAHANPELFKFFLASADLTDSRGNRALNLDGLIVILGMNVDKSDANYQKLVDGEFGKGDYHSNAGGLFQGTLLKQKNPLSAEIAGPVSSRLPNKYFFKPLSQSRDELEKLVGEAVRKISERHHCQVILPDAVRKRFLDAMTNYKNDNYRGIETMLDKQITMAVTRYERGSLNAKLDGGTFVLTHLDGENFTLENANTPENKRFIIQESYNQYCAAVKLEMQREIAAIHQHLKLPLSSTERASTEYLAQSYERALAAFIAAAERPLFKKNERTGEYEIDPGTIGEFPRPGAKQGEALAHLRKLAVPMFPQVPGHYVEPSADPHRAARFFTHSAAMVRELEKQTMTGGPELPGNQIYGPPSTWLEGHGATYVDWKSGNEKEDRRKREVEFMKARLDEWREHIKALETQPLRAAQTQATITMGRKFQMELQSLPPDKADKEVLETFIAALISPGGMPQAEEMLKGREAPPSGAQPREKSQMGTMQLIDVSAGFVVDHYGRQLAAEQLEAQKPNTRGGGAPSSESAPCRNTWQSMGDEASEELTRIFARRV